MKEPAAAYFLLVRLNQFHPPTQIESQIQYMVLYVGFRDLIEVVMKSFFFWDIV